MLHVYAKFQDPRPFGSGDFKGFGNSPGGHLCHVIWTVYYMYNFLFPHPRDASDEIWL